MSSTDKAKISAQAYYREYHGHKVSDLEQVLPSLRASAKRLIWTAGDSSLDNKYWFRDTADAVGAYQNLLEPPVMKQDVTYWLNYYCQKAPDGSARHGTAAINTAVEATTLNERTFRLRPQDVFLRDNIQPEDILIVSVGGNDVAMAPCLCTIVSIAGVLCLPTRCIEESFDYCVLPCDDYCCGCGPSLCSCAGACPPCMGYFRHMFGTRVQHYVRALTAKTKPSKILVCMIYYPDETVGPGWANKALGFLGYNKNPAKLQTMIRKAFSDATSTVTVPGSQVIPVPLFHALDGKNTKDYVERVEPSVTGGSKMAELFLDIIDNNNKNSSYHSTASGAPTSALMKERD